MIVWDVEIFDAQGHNVHDDGGQGTWDDFERTIRELNRDFPPAKGYDFRVALGACERPLFAPDTNTKGNTNEY